MLIGNRNMMHKTGMTLLFFLLLFLLAACRPARYPQVLQEADSLASACPDSAVALLHGLRAEMAEERRAVQMYYRLLCIKAQDKAYIPHTSDSAVLSVLHYYEERKDRRHLPEAYYYAGRVCRDLGDAPQALDYFGKALEAMPQDGMLPLRGKVLSQMGTLFYRQSMYPEALEMYKKSLACDSVLGDSLGMAFSLRDMGNTYIGLGDKDSTLNCLLQANRICEALRDSTLIYTIQNSIAWLYTNRKEFDAAKAFLHRALQATPEPEKASVYVTAGIWHQMQSQLDSAAAYYKAAIRCGAAYTKRMAYGNLSQIALAQGDPDAAIQYLKRRNAYADSVQISINTEGIRRMYALYNYQLREKENSRLREANARKTQNIVYLALGAGLLLVGSGAFYRKRKKQWKAQWENAENLRKEAYRRSAQFVQDNRAEMEKLQKKIRQLQRDLKDKGSMLEELERQKAILANTNQQTLLEQDKRRLAEEGLFSSDIYLHFRQQLEEEVPHLTPQDWNDLQEQLDACYDGFTRKLHTLHLRLSSKEMQTCMLIKARFSNTEIGKLTHTSVEGVSSRRSRLYEKVFHEKKGSKEWDAFIRSL